MTTLPPRLVRLFGLVLSNEVRDFSSLFLIYSKRLGAGNEIRTRDLNLGKVALYQLSYSR